MRSGKKRCSHSELFSGLVKRVGDPAEKWKRPIRDWKSSLNQFVILYGDKMPTEP